MGYRSLFSALVLVSAKAIIIMVNVLVSAKAIIMVNGATGSISAIGSPNDPLTLNGDCELSIAIEWIKWRHLNGANGRQWRSPMSPMDVAIGATHRIAIGAPMEHPLAPLIVANGAK